MKTCFVNLIIDEATYINIKVFYPREGDLRAACAKLATTLSGRKVSEQEVNFTSISIPHDEVDDEIHFQGRERR